MFTSSVSLTGTSSLTTFLSIESFASKIIDFDIAIQVKDEDEEVVGQCGTEVWMAPEVEMLLMYSPIKADRWSCGRVLLCLLNQLGGKRRASEGDWDQAKCARSQAATFITHSGPIGFLYGPMADDESKAPRAGQDTMEADMEHPDTKKQRLAVLDPNEKKVDVLRAFEPQGTSN